MDVFQIALYNLEMEMIYTVGVSKMHSIIWERHTALLLQSWNNFVHYLKMGH